MFTLTIFSVEPFAPVVIDEGYDTAAEAWAAYRSTSPNPDVVFARVDEV